jgi:N-acetylglucosamine kinase-like BadF-type ATPase
VRYVIGIDGGATKTLVVILDEYGRLCGVGSSGSTNYDNIGFEAALEHMRQAVDQAVAEAGLTAHRGSANPAPLFAAAFLGIAGTVSHKDTATVLELGRRLNLAPIDKIGVDHDCRIALAGGLSGRPGIVLIAGTGASCFGVNTAGDRWLVGGWGHLLADDGSSYWLGLQALRTAMASYDGRIGPTVLTGRLQAALQLGEMVEMMHRVYVDKLSTTEVAALAPIVTAAAVEGDAVAQGIIQKGVETLSECVETLARRLNLGQAGHGAVEVVLVGGLLRAGAVITGPLYAAIRARVPGCILTMPELPPVIGAGLLALQTAGYDAADPTIVANLRSAAADLSPGEPEGASSRQAAEG